MVNAIRGILINNVEIETMRETGEQHGIELEVVKRTEAKQGFVLLPRRWVAERGFA